MSNINTGIAKINREPSQSELDAKYPDSYTIPVEQAAAELAVGATVGGAILAGATYLVGKAVQKIGEQI